MGDELAAVARWSPSTPRCLAGGVVVAIERVAVVAELDLDALAALVAIEAVALATTWAPSTSHAAANRMGDHVPPRVAWVLSGASRPRVRGTATIRQLIGFRQGYQ